MIQYMGWARTKENIQAILILFKYKQIQIIRFQKIIKPIKNSTNIVTFMKALLLDINPPK